MANRDRQSVSRISPIQFHTGQLDLDHMFDLLLGGVTNTDHSLLDGIRCVFPNWDAHLGRDQQSDRPRLPKLQCGNPVFVDECLLNRGAVGLICGEDVSELLICLLYTSPSPRDS